MPLCSERLFFTTAALCCTWAAFVVVSMASPGDGTAPVTRLVAHAGAQNCREASPSTPELVADKTLHDFGRIRCGSIHTAAFHLTNAGASPLRIANVQGCCGVVTELDKRELAPNESAVLRAV